LVIDGIVASTTRPTKTSIFLVSTKKARMPKLIGQAVAKGDGREKRTCPTILSGQADKET
jgi:hypothetical protein